MMTTQRTPDPDGATLLDRFALNLAKAFLTNDSIRRRLLTGSCVRLRRAISRASYRMADAMMEERKNFEIPAVMDASPRQADSQKGMEP